MADRYYGLVTMDAEGQSGKDGTQVIVTEGDAQRTGFEVNSTLRKLT